ncbi:MAG: peptidyl-prolyl cis-trans isomerase [Planctomycetes bacterium]|nr:peptidyl-prolyl cis-trans isomerase [Planctomycetota bacterium]
MTRFLREPLLHFLLAGALLFGAHAWITPGAVEAPRTVRISEAEVRWLKETWARQWQRPPSEQELRDLVSDYVKEVLLAAEARELGLDDNDTIIRRRLAQKMEFIVKDTARLDEPDERVLRALFEELHATFQAPARISFTQLFFKSEAAAREGLAALASNPAADPGERTLLEREHFQSDETAMTAQFGHEFSSWVISQAAGDWRGPVASAYGFHLVRITERLEARQRPFEEVRFQVAEEWHRRHQTQVNDAYLAGLFRKYDLVLDESVKALVGPPPEAPR